MEDRPMFEARLAGAQAVLARTRMYRASYAPPVYRLLWRVGVAVRPPHFRTFVANLSFTALGYGACLFVLAYAARGVGAWRALAFSAALGGLFGCWMAAYYTWSARRHRLPPWPTLSAEGLASARPGRPV